MSVRSDQLINQIFTTRRFDTGEASNADATPSGTLYVNGEASTAAVTVTSLGTGIYLASLTLPSLSLEDRVALKITATVGGVTDNWVIWQDSQDLFDSTLTAATLQAISGYGTGDILVDHDYGGEDNLTVKTAEGLGIEGADIHIYSQTDYDAGRRSSSYIVAKARTGSGGQWLNPVMLSGGDYVLVVFERGSYTPSVVPLTVE